MITPGQKLSEIRTAVLTRCTLNTVGNQGARAQTIVDEMARSAQRVLWLQCDWTRLRVRQSIAFAAGVATYDFPDNLDPGQIDNVCVVRASDGKQFPLRPGMNSMERNSGLSTTSGRPLLYTFENQMITLVPTPDNVVWTSMVIEGVTGLPAFVDDDETCAVDSEALIQRTEIMVRPRLGFPVDKSLLSDHAEYLSLLRSQQSDGASILLGGATSQALTPEGENRVGKQRVGWDSGWNPPGQWGS